MHGINSRGQRAHQRFGFVARADQCTKHADHVEDAGDVTLIEGVNRHIIADQLRDDVGLQIGEGQDEIRLERENFRNVGRDERRDPRLLAPNLGRPHGIA
jgi:hypothetical protein